jgi:hypothetical protein
MQAFTVLKRRRSCLCSRLSWLRAAYALFGCAMRTHFTLAKNFRICDIFWGYQALNMKIIVVKVRAPCSWSWGHVTTNGQLVRTSWCRTHCATCDQTLIGLKFAVLSLCSLLSEERSGLSLVSYCQHYFPNVKFSSFFSFFFIFSTDNKTLRGLSPRTNYTGQVTAVCRWS